MAMKAIKSFNDIKLLRQNWSRIFTTNDPFRDPFQSTVQAKLLFYPTYGYHLTKEQYTAIVRAAQSIGIPHCYISVIEYDGDFFSKGQHWKCYFPKYDEYISIPLVLENALYADGGVFGMLLSHEDHAILGGSSIFVNSLKKYYPNWRKERQTIKMEWQKKLADPVLSATK
jgi:hypothetical protein